MAKTEQKVQTCTAAERKAAYQEVYCSHRNPEWSSANSGKDYVRPYKKTKSREAQRERKEFLAEQARQEQEKAKNKGKKK